MPYIYTHDTFGKKVADSLPEELQEIIKKHPKQFQIGLQGPDFLFFYHPLLKLRTNRLGYWQHEQPMSHFLGTLLPSLRKAKNHNSGIYAYLLGYICHFVLDSECHNYIISLSKKKGYNHLVIESEFDRHLLRKDGYIPTTYPIWKKIPTTDAVVDVIHKAYRPLRLAKKKIRRALICMRFYKRLLTCGCSLKRALLRGIMKLTFQYHKLEGHMMSLRPKSYATRTNRKLQKIYDNAISLAKDLIVDFHKSVLDGKDLHPRFSTNFRSNY